MMNWIINFNIPEAGATVIIPWMVCGHVSHINDLRTYGSERVIGRIVRADVVVVVVVVVALFPPANSSRHLVFTL